MRKTETTLALAIALLCPMIVGAQTNGGASGQTAPAAPAASDPQAALKAAKDQVKQDRAAIKADKKAAKTSCQNAGADCDAAKAKVKADQAQLKTDQASLKAAWKAANPNGASGKHHHHDGDSGSGNGGATNGMPGSSN